MRAEQQTVSVPSPGHGITKICLSQYLDLPGSRMYHSQVTPTRAVTALLFSCTYLSPLVSRGIVQNVSGPILALVLQRSGK